MDDRVCCNCRLRTVSLIITVVTAVMGACGLFAVVSTQQQYHTEWEFIVEIVAAAILLLVSLLAIFGILMDRALMILPWIILLLIELILMTIKLVLQFIYKIQDYEAHKGLVYVIVELLVGIVGVLIFLYIVNIVRRYYHYLKHSY